MLDKLFDKYECDKGTGKHHYYKEYEKYFEPVREEEINLLEIGTFKGASTRAFYEYFPNANIYTIDIFARTLPEELDILSKERVHWLKADSTDASLGQLMNDAWNNIKFDFIIDDGAHWPEANRLTLQNTIKFLKNDGVYFIEDVWPMHIMNQKQLDHPWLRKHSDRYDMLKHMQFLNYLDQFDIVTHDRRKETKQPDTFIYALRKND